MASQAREQLLQNDFVLSKQIMLCQSQITSYPAFFGGAPLLLPHHLHSGDLADGSQITDPASGQAAALCQVGNHL